MIKHENAKNGTKPYSASKLDDILLRYVHSSDLFMVGEVLDEHKRFSKAALPTGHTLDPLGLSSRERLIRVPHFAPQATALDRACFTRPVVVCAFKIERTGRALRGNARTARHVLSLTVTSLLLLYVLHVRTTWGGSASSILIQNSSPDLQHGVTLVRATSERLPDSAPPRVAFNHSDLKPNWFDPAVCKSRNSSCWDHCLPFKGSSELQKCASASRLDLEQVTANYCHTSVLHMLLEDVWNTIKSNQELSKLRPLLTLGTLLGAFRNESLIRWTHDVDIAYSKSAWTTPVEDILHQELVTKGYTLFHEGIWRVCLHSGHPFAGKIYNAQASAHAKRAYAGDIPYLDMYSLQEDYGIFRHETQMQKLKTTDVLPTRNVTLLGKEYETFRNPVIFFMGAGYGDFMQERVEDHR